MGWVGLDDHGYLLQPERFSGHFLPKRSPSLLSSTHPTPRYHHTSTTKDPPTMLLQPRKLDSSAGGLRCHHTDPNITQTQLTTPPLPSGHPGLPLSSSVCPALISWGAICAIVWEHNHPIGYHDRKETLWGSNQNPRAPTAGRNRPPHTVQPRATAAWCTAPRAIGTTALIAGGHRDDGSEMPFCQRALAQVGKARIPALLQNPGTSFKSWELLPCTELPSLLCTAERTALSCAKTCNTERSDTAARSASPGH